MTTTQPGSVTPLSEMIKSHEFLDNIEGGNLQVVQMDGDWLQIVSKTFLGYFGTSKQPLLGFNLTMNTQTGAFFLTLFSRVCFPKAAVITPIQQINLFRSSNQGH